MERWVNKVAVVTGASSGIGNAIVKDLVKHGMKVCALARRKDRLDDLKKEINNDTKFKALSCDVSKPDEVKAAIKCIEKTWGEINVLINNAGVSCRTNLTEATNELSTVFGTNVFGLATCVHEVFAVMKKHKTLQGHIININSIVGHYIPKFNGISPYVASKHAVTVLTESLKNELAEQKSPIRVTSLSPGLVKTEMTTAYHNTDIPKLDASDISNCIIFVLSLPDHVNISEITVEPTGEHFTSLRSDTNK